MIGLSFLRSKLIRRARLFYNSGNYSKSLWWAKRSYFLFRDRESLDIIARSNLRLKLFSKAAKAYALADSKGFSLLDHLENQFKAEISSGNIIDSFSIYLRLSGSQKKSALKRIIRELKKSNDTERVEVIQKMNQSSNLPEGIAELLPWTPKKIDFEDDEKRYSSLQKSTPSQESYIREINRIRSSGAFQILDLLAKSVRSPIKILTLTYKLPSLCFNLVFRRTGKYSDIEERQYIVSPPGSKRDCIVMFPTNGVGFGHFTRLLSISRSIREKSPETEIVFFTTMPTLHIPSQNDMICYHLPGRYRYSDMDANTWNSICEELLSTVFSLHRPKAFIFDGAYPYRGMLNAIKSQPGLLKVWLRRGSIKKSSKSIPAGSINQFDAIIKPGDSTIDSPNEELQQNIPIIKTNPILLEENISGENLDIRKRLGIPTESTLCYVQLGAGNINDIDDELSITLRALANHQSVYVIIGESMIGKRIEIDENIDQERFRILRDYPNSRYFNHIDFAIIAGGYNSFHEVINFQIPSICYPNLKTGRDDQLARANVAKQKGAMIVIKERNRERISLAIGAIIDRKVRDRMKKKLAEMKSNNGTQTARDWIINQIS